MIFHNFFYNSSNTYFINFNIYICNILSNNWLTFNINIFVISNLNIINNCKNKYINTFIITSSNTYKNLYLINSKNNKKQRQEKF